MGPLESVSAMFFSCNMRCLGMAVLNHAPMREISSKLHSDFVGSPSPYLVIHPTVHLQLNCLVKLYRTYIIVGFEKLANLEALHLTLE